MTDREKAIVMAYTGVSMLQGDKMAVLFDYVEEITGIRMNPLQMAMLAEEIKRKAEPDFIKLCEDATDKNVGCKWISVKDRLPEVEKRVLLLTDKGVTCGFYEDGKMWQDDSKVNWDYDIDLDYDEEQDAYRIPEGWVEESLEEHDEWNCVVLGYKVTHWMPLPELPKEAEDANR